MLAPRLTVLPALQSRLDFSILHAMRARRSAGEQSPFEKLALLRRLAHSATFHALPETRVEQSWNEQLFAKIFGYRTLLSHDALPFHILPKNPTASRRFDDFSLGFFGVEDPKLLGTAELKSPGTNLDAPQTSGNYSGHTPVEQALSAAVGHGPSCRWVLVSNCFELRLYDKNAPGEPLAVADLRAVRNPDDLALLSAHFDAAALLGEHGKDNAQMAAALTLDHLSHPLPPRIGHCRLVLRLVRKDGLVLALFRTEKALRGAAAAVSALFPAFMPVSDYQILARDGWVSVDMEPHARLSASRFGDLQLSTAIPLQVAPLPRDGQASLGPVLDTAKMIESTRAFIEAASAFYRMSFGTTSFAGTISGELREVQNVALSLAVMQEPTAPWLGMCPAPEIAAGDFDCSGASARILAPALASCLCELAIQFRDKRGGVGLSHQQLTVHLERAQSAG